MRLLLIFLALPVLMLIGLHAAKQPLTVNKSAPETAPVRIMVISDLNAAYGSSTYSADVHNVIAKVDSISPDLILCAGDMVAGQKATLTAAQTRAMWDAFSVSVLDPVKKAGIPFGFTIGNHDGSPNFTQDRMIAKEFWEKEGATTGLNIVDRTNFPFYYSYLQQGIFIISWDASGADQKPEMYKWMEAQLSSKAARNARLRIVLGHLPLFAIVAAKNKPGEVLKDPERAMELFTRYKVAMYISGHQHAYFPASRKGVTLFNAGAIGNGPRQLLGSAAPARKAYSVLTIPTRRKMPMSFTTYDAATGSAIELSELPERITGFNGESIRMDMQKK